MKHVKESLSQYYDYKFFKILEEDKSEKSDLQDKEKDGLAVIDKLKSNFEEFKKSAKGEILKYKEFWEENQQAKEAFDESGELYKMFNSDYVIGVLTLPVETLSDGSIEGGFGATDEPEEEIIEGKEIGATEELSEDSESLTEAEETDELDLDLGIDQPNEDTEMPEPEEDAETKIEIPELPDTEVGVEDTQTSEEPMEEPMDDTGTTMSDSQKYFVVYDISGDEREEILRCGSNNVVNSFSAFYNDTFKGSMKNAILAFKKKKEELKKEAEKSEKEKIQKDKQSKIKKFLGKTNESLNESEAEEEWTFKPGDFVKFSIKDMKLEFEDNEENGQIAISHNGKMAMVVSQVMNNCEPGECDKDYEYYDIEFNDGARIEGISGYHLGTKRK